MTNLSVKIDTLSYNKTRLHELFGQIEKEFEALWEENQELKAKLGLIPPVGSAPGSPAALRGKQATGGDTRGGLKLPRYMKLPKNVKSQSKKNVQKWVKVKDFVGHRDGVWEVTSCPWDVGYLGSASADHSARLWSADGSRTSIVYLAHTGSVNSIRFHPTERLVCTSSGDRTCHIWKVPVAIQQTRAPTQQTTQQQQPNKLTNKLSHVKLWTPLLERDKSKEDIAAISADGVSPNANSSPSLPSYPVGDLRPGSGLSTPLSSSTGNIPLVSVSSGLAAAHHHANDSLIPGGNPYELDDASSPNVTVTRTALVELKGHTGAVVGAGWLMGGQMVATASWDHTVRLWSVDSEDRPVSTVPAGHEKPHRITHLSSQPTSPLVVFSSTDGAFRIWDTRNNAPQTETVFAHQGPVTSVILAPDGSTLVSSSDDRTVKVWDARNTKAARTTIRCHAAVNKISISPISSTLLIPTDERRTVVYDVNGVCKGKLHHQEKFGHKYMISSTAWSTDESVIYTTGFDRKIIAWAREQPQ